MDETNATTNGVEMTRVWGQRVRKTEGNHKKKKKQIEIEQRKTLEKSTRLCS